MPPARKTYSHLAGARRMPTTYEIETSRLLYYVERGGFALDLPTSDWYRRYQTGSPLACDRWEAFEDPRATTYASYVRLQRDRELFVAGVLEPAAANGYDDALTPEWVDTLDRTLPTLRFAGHGLQMVAAYVGQMAPSGRVTVAALFQAADEIRRIQGIAFRMAQLRRRRSAFGDASRERWQSDPVWQPLRRIIETLFVTYDWGEALVALNVCVKPLFDELFTVGLAALADRQGNYVEAQLLRSFAADSAWQRGWTTRLLELARQDQRSRDAIQRWIAAWRPLAETALAQAAASLGAGGTADADRALRNTAPFIDAFTRNGEGRDAA